ncbi:MAG: NUDIX hydrolase [Candidatus Kerfeldbacteria bacterium]|nr:NUDIX hydrolase [Candidatus Kerfeldbacteria bacterium]
MELQVGVKALITDGRGKYLFLKRALPYDGETEPRWDIPGGRINAGEPIAEALAREIKEETGLIMKGVPRVLYAQDILRLKEKHVVRLTFEVEVEPSQITIDTDDPNGTHHNAFAWIAKEEIKNLHHDIYLTPVFKLMGLEPEP